MFAVVYIFLMLFTLLFLAAIRSKEAPIVLAGSALLFATCAFCLEPRGGGLYVDMIRFFETLDSARAAFDFGGVKFAWACLADQWNNDSTPVAGLILLLVSATSQNGWINFIAALADVGSAFYLIYKEWDKGASRSVLIISVAFFIMYFNFTSAVSGVRCTLAGSLACCVAYSGLNGGGHKVFYLLVFVPLILIHPFAASIALVYIVASLKLNKRAVFVVAAVVLVMQGFLQTYVFQFFALFPNIPFFASLSFKSTQYFGEGAYIGSDSIFSRFREIAMFVVLLLICASYFLAKKKRGLEFSRYDRCVCLYLCFTAGCIMDEQLFARCTSYLLFLVLPVFCGLLGMKLVLGIQRDKNLTLLFLLLIFVGFVRLADNVRAGVRFFLVSPSAYTFLVLVVCLVAVILFASGVRNKLKDDRDCAKTSLNSGRPPHVF